MAAAFPDHVPIELRWDRSFAEHNSEMDDPFRPVGYLRQCPFEVFHDGITDVSALQSM